MMKQNLDAAASHPAPSPLLTAGAYHTPPPRPPPPSPSLPSPPAAAYFQLVRSCRARRSHVCCDAVLTI
ncbi:unnamed protein product [Danaus chrysippus]|uniref:(African queen) hypothetical protein n=1 Tax=Danaus chrysippus TaxID=151541 RepID=A0A8J2QC48_9NEOP|nr:unnamed protein product [Danaus chrysippus]